MMTQYRYYMSMDTSYQYWSIKYQYWNCRLLHLYSSVCFNIDSITSRDHHHYCCKNNETHTKLYAWICLYMLMVWAKLGHNQFVTFQSFWRPDYIIYQTKWVDSVGNGAIFFIYCSFKNSNLKLWNYDQWATSSRL